ncbi:hypothetical protein [Lactiplantibacillus pentosus]|uniref:hypothetical protein n=1 Tax=Lactiplantibacillus pentosus TaxID=1589 RepID=UPI000704C789|nr:hypothetical protein [Lactiplantibacillus pentosus]AYJ42469.1 hypothetical protein LP314_11590 [Lactiplantibacillus pentosus]MCT3311981.1 hypothetical protein [Lactiplantibacillus pentosus]PKX55421.1 hypothetical protein BIS22_10360 [Lactiplantibacillus pentosus]TDG91994.1 hypothetical protein C5L29_002440 [Lactiplantibacillus pentosus]UZO87572.1 hypothetical protein HPK28_11280 [Lactiplantibacillus pentosus]
MVWIRKNWNPLLTTAISIFALAISALGWWQQHNATQVYRNNTRQVIKNSTKLAVYDIDLLIYKVSYAKNVPLSKEQLAYQTDSLNQNLSIIKDVQITNLPKSESMNYQVYRADLSNVIYRINSSLNQIEDISKKNSKFKGYIDGQLYFNSEIQETFLRELVLTRNVILEDEHTVKKGGDLYEHGYEKQRKALEKEDKNIIDEYGGPGD